MKTEVVKMSGDLRRERWGFWLDGDIDHLYLSYYVFETRESRRHGWKKQTQWTRLDTRSNTIDVPPKSSEVIEDMRRQYIETFTEVIKSLSVGL